VAFMDPYLTKWPDRSYPEGTTADPRVGVKPDNFFAPIRDAMGTTLTYANRMNLAAMTPQPSLCSTHFCLANSGAEYLVYQPSPKTFTLRLPAGTYHYEWLNPATNLVGATSAMTVPDGNQSFTAPFAGDAVLYLHASAR
jgi:hypothetical protein